MADYQQVQQAISWNRFALLSTLLLYILQQVGLLYYIGMYSLSLLFLAAVDFVIALMLVLNGSKEYAAMEGGAVWVVYAWSLSVKYLIFFFVVYSTEGPHYGVVFPGPVGGVLEVGLLFSVGAAVYALLAFRASECLYGGISHFSADSMLHTDLVTHVAMDLLDGVAAFHTFSLVPTAISANNGWLHLLAGIFVSLAIFLHGYSFPSVGSQSVVSARDSTRDSGDIKTVRKHAALVGICLVDLPLLSIRLFTWAYYPSYQGFSPFMFKNICFIPIQFARLRQCSLAAHLEVAQEAAAQRALGIADGSAEGLAAAAGLPPSAALVLSYERDGSDVLLYSYDNEGALLAKGGPGDETAEQLRGILKKDQPRFSALRGSLSIERRRKSAALPLKPVKEERHEKVPRASVLRRLAFWRNSHREAKKARRIEEERNDDYDARSGGLKDVIASYFSRCITIPRFPV